MLRNSVKYGRKRKDDDPLKVTMRLRNPGDASDYWLLELWDNFSGFDKDDEKQEDVETTDAKITKHGAYATLCNAFAEDVIDEKEKIRIGGHRLNRNQRGDAFSSPAQ